MSGGQIFFDLSFGAGPLMVVAFRLLPIKADLLIYAAGSVACMMCSKSSDEYNPIAHLGEGVGHSVR